MINSKKLRHVMIGKPIATSESHHQAIDKRIGLAVFASDALSSVAYAPGEILLVLMLAGTAYTYLSIPIAAAIIGMLLILTISYRQTIFAYPSGGGAYIVARDNIGEIPAQVAGAALLTDYILTVAVSISSGFENVAATFPFIKSYEAELAVITVLFMMVMNLRGVKESGKVFAVPTYFFLGTMAVTLVVGFFRYATGSLPRMEYPAEELAALQHNAMTLGLLLVLRAFSSGCTALTGVEAISNGITAFKEPKSRNAASTMLAMSLLIVFIFGGITILTNLMGVLPRDHDPAVIPYISALLFGPGIVTSLITIGIMLILIMAANTSFADFPRLCALQAGDGFLPRQLTIQGSRLVFSWGIVALSISAITLIVIFNAHTSSLIPLYAIGVFLSFTLSQFGMVKRWLRIGKIKVGKEMSVRNAHGDVDVLRHDKQWRLKLIINAVGGIMSFIVMCVFAITKFTEGAWITVILIPTLVFIFFRIHVHYKSVAQTLSLSGRAVHPERRPIKTIALINDIHAGTVQLIEFVMSMGGDYEAIHLDNDTAKTERILAKWNERMGDTGHELKIIPAPYRDLTEPVVNYVQNILDGSENGFVHVVLAQIIMDSWAEQALHSNTSIAFKLALQHMDRVVVTDVSYPLHISG
ncbi:MAG: APC family permease [Anaerolineae bacterium]|nr:APC family permease [Anaerolineae bacterium]